MSLQEGRGVPLRREMKEILYLLSYGSVLRKGKMHKPLTILVTTICVMFTWVFWVSSYGVNKRHSRAAIISNPGVIHDLEQDSFGFSIKGFDFYKKCPVRKKKTLKATSIWLLTTKNKYGTIAFKDIQKKHIKPRDVTVVIKYHINWEGTAKLSVNGLDLKNHELVTVQLSQYGIGYCTRVIYLGPVHQVAIVATTTVNESFVIIDELKIGVGTNDFDSLDEENCA